MEEKKELGMGWYKFLKNWTFGIGIVISFLLVLLLSSMI